MPDPAPRRFGQTQIDPDEVKVHCDRCNGYLWSAWREKGVRDIVPCPYKCRLEPDGSTSMTLTGHEKDRR